MTLEIITSDSLLPFRHGFFTRRGGASSGIFSGLNCGHGSSDQTEAVEINRARVAEAMGVAPAALASVHQVHSAEVLSLSEAPQTPRPRADAMVTATPGLALAVLTADCQPVLFADPKAKVIGAAHAGWRGALAGVIEATVLAMTDLGARAERIHAAIGPCIAQASYEVGPDLQGAVLAEDPDGASLFLPVAGSDRLLFDLKGYALRRLARAGVAGCAALPEDTFADDTRFFSARRTRRRGGARFGLLLSAIALAER
jgi:YfiH family protein